MKKKRPKKTKNSRHIPTSVSQKVKERHFFECAWCGEKLTHRHHIKEWHLGGKHTEENLILLCPKCHDLTHRGFITSDQLFERKSTHLKHDRVSGIFQTTLEKCNFKIGNNFFLNIEKHIVVYKYQPIISAEKYNTNVVFGFNLFNESGDLIFWMRKNSYWAPQYFVIESTLDKFTITDTRINLIVLRLTKIRNYIQIECTTYLGKHEFCVKPNQPIFFNGTALSHNVVSNFYIGLWLAMDGLTKTSFLKKNKENTARDVDGIICDDINESIKYHETLIKEDPDNSVSWACLAIAYLQSNNTEKGIHALKKATEKDPTNRAAWTNLGSAYFNNKNYVASIQAYEKALNVDSEFFLSWRILAMAYQRIGMYDKAKKAFENADLI